MNSKRAVVGLVATLLCLISAAAPAESPQATLERLGQMSSDGFTESVSADCSGVVISQNNGAPIEWHVALPDIQMQTVNLWDAPPGTGAGVEPGLSNLQFHFSSSPSSYLSAPDSVRNTWANEVSIAFANRGDAGAFSAALTALKQQCAQ